jgi:hypothetical protein
MIQDEASVTEADAPGAGIFPNGPDAPTPDSIFLVINRFPLSFERSGLAQDLDPDPDFQ